MTTEVFETENLLVKRLAIKDDAPYKVAARLVIPVIAAGKTVIVYGESHGDPRQSKQARECSWVTGIEVVGVGDVCRRRGQDLYYAQKAHECRIGQWKANLDMVNVDICYVMRAINLHPGGEFRVSWIKLGAIVYD